MTGELITPSDALEMLSSMYLCKPSGEAVEYWKAALSTNASIFLYDLTEAVSEIDTSSKHELDELLWEYTRLFIGPYKLPCPPWESVYTSPKRLMMQDAAEQVMNFYREAGLVVNSADAMPDHIGIELNFLALLLRKSKSGGEAVQKTELIYDFINDHLVKWVPDFTRDMENASETRFYRTLAGTTRNLVDFFGR